MSASRFRTRLAPSPTGELHLGNARTFVLTWLLARQAGGSVVLRIEDLDSRRVKPGSIDTQIAQLEWLGLDWDEGPVIQSKRTGEFARAIEQLTGSGLVYPCVCSRKEIESAASAPHASDEGPRYPGTCRGRFSSIEEARQVKGGEPALRFIVSPGPVSFDDGIRGPTTLDPSAVGGDFVVRSPDSQFSYQLAVSVDDAAMGITEVIRGDDLLTSTPRQILLHRALGYSPPRYSHLPLVLAQDGSKLSKRRKDLDLSALAARGVTPDEVLSWIASSAGIEVRSSRVTLRDLIGALDLRALPANPLVLGDSPFARNDFGGGGRGP